MNAPRDGQTASNRFRMLTCYAACSSSASNPGGDAETSLAQEVALIHALSFSNLDGNIYRLRPSESLCIFRECCNPLSDIRLDDLLAALRAYTGG